MIDIKAIDELYKAGIRTCAIFDKRVLFPFPQLLQAILAETDLTVSEVELRVRAAEGWFPLLKGAGVEGNEEGAPLYVPSRIGLLTKLQNSGWGPGELRLVANNEEWLIDNCLSGDEMPYLDDDLDLLIRFLSDRIEAFEHSTGGLDPEREREAARTRQELELMLSFKKNGAPEDRRPVIEKLAFRARAYNEFLRLWQVQMERDKVLTGFSPFVVCGHSSWNQEVGFRSDHVDWPGTIRAAMAYASSGVEPPIRVPGLVLRGDHVVPTITLRPAEYGHLWRERDLESYLKCWAELHNERRCLNCFAALGEADQRKRFCGDKCRNASKQRRFRERNPDSIEQIQKRYWDSIDIE